jgi:hypothetical protein
MILFVTWIVNILSSKQTIIEFLTVEWNLKLEKLSAGLGLVEG